MSKVRSDNISNRADDGAPALVYGAEVPVGYGITGAGGINITGIATAASFSGNISGNVTGNISGGTVAGSTGTFTGDVDIADKIVHTGDTNTAIRFPANDTVTVETSGSERVRVTSAGLVGVNCTPTAQFQVKAGTDANFNFSTGSGESSFEILNDAGSANVPLNVRASEYKIKIQGTEKVRITSTGEVRIGDNSTTASTAGDDLVIEGSSDRGISIISGTSSSGNVYFGDSGDTDIGRIAYQHNDNAFQFYTSATKRVQVDSDGIKFSSDTAAANGLNDYEEGNGTPSVSFETSGTATLGAGASFKYVKIGDLVTFSFEFQLSAVSSPSGGVRLALPFASGAGVYSAGAVRLYNVTFTGSPFLQIGPSSSSVVVLGSVSGGATSQINGTGYYFGTISYRTSS